MPLYMIERRFADQLDFSADDVKLLESINADEGVRWVFSFLIPIYFAVVGVKLDLLHDFDVLFFVGFLAFACAVKAASVFVAARVAGSFTMTPSAEPTAMPQA